MIDVDDQDLKQVSILANTQRELENKIAKQEEELKETKRQLKQVSEVDIPEALAESGLSEIKLTDGTKVSVQQFYSASIPKDKVDCMAA